MRSLGRKQLIVSAVLLALGGVLAWLTRSGRTLTALGTASDVLFCQGSVLLVWGIVLMLGNVHAFTSFSYGFRSFHRLVQGRQLKGTEMKEDYLRYRQSRPHHDDAPFYLVLAAVWLIAALAIAMAA